MALIWLSASYVTELFFFLLVSHEGTYRTHDLSFRHLVRISLIKEGISLGASTSRAAVTPTLEQATRTIKTTVRTEHKSPCKPRGLDEPLYSNSAAALDPAQQPRQLC